MYGRMGILIEESQAQVVALWPGQLPTVVTVPLPGAGDRRWQEVIDVVQAASELLVLGSGPAVRELCNAIGADASLRNRLVGVIETGPMNAQQLRDRVSDGFRAGANGSQAR
jgi:hypothetical protein